MAKKRTRKPPVRPELAKQWLRRHEEDGESVPQIAQSDGYDVRTVRKQIQLQIQAREVREARQVVLRQALEKHYVDLCSFAEKLRAGFSVEYLTGVSMASTADPMWGALRQHLPRASLWRRMERWDSLAGEFQAALENLKGRARTEASSRTSLEFIRGLDKVGLQEGFVAGLVWHLRQVAEGASGLSDEPPRLQRTEHGVIVGIGAFTVALVPDEARASDIDNAFRNLIVDAARWEKWDTFLKNSRELAGLYRDIREELTRVILRRVLSGRCLYCPF